jgi:hypothetical protein
VFVCCSIVLSCWYVTYICIVHIDGVHILCLGWINNVHTTKCIVNVHLFCFLFDILAWAFMSKLPIKLQPLKSFKYKYLFGDKIPKRDGAFSSHIHVDVLLPFPLL